MRTKSKNEACQSVICHKCHDREHYNLDCVLPFRHQTKAIQNYKQLTPAEKMTVQIISYHRVRKILGPENEKDKIYKSGSHSPAPYPRESKYCNSIYVQNIERHQQGLLSSMIKNGGENMQATLEMNGEN